MKSMRYIRLVLVGVLLVCSVSVSVGQTWLATSAPHDFWNDITCSADGQIVLATTASGSLYISTNAGSAWAADPALSGCIDIALTGDGRNLAALADDQIFTSTDGGANWSTNALPTNGFVTLASSASGNLLFASTGLAPGYLSTNWGQTWTNSSLNDSFMERAAISADGSRLIAACSASLVYLSTDSGASWSPTSLPVDQWNSVASSADGATLAVVSEGGTIFTSSDYGSNWSGGYVGDNANWRSVACSSNGVNLFAASSIGFVYQSTNSGQSWFPNFSPYSLYRVAASADGTHAYTSEFSGNIFSFQASGPLQIKPTGLGMLLIWPDYLQGVWDVSSSPSLTDPVWSPVDGIRDDVNGMLQLAQPTSEGSLFYELYPAAQTSVRIK